MSAQAHIYVYLTCEKCGHEWSVEDYDSTTVYQAEEKATDEPCPICNGDQP